MALNVTNLMTVLGKGIKQINTLNGYFSALSTAKGEIYSVLDTANQEDLYVTVPGIYQSFYDQLAEWIQSLITWATAVVLDEETVLDELPLPSQDLASVLNGIIDYMHSNSVTVDASVVTLAAADTDKARFDVVRPEGNDEYVGFHVPQVFVSRLLDGINAPAVGVAPYHRYNNVTSELAMSATVYGKVSADTPGSEVLQLFSASPAQSPYTFDSEAPGTGPTIVNMESGNLIAQNYDFSSWSGNNPQPGWTVTGGSAGTDWVDESGSGVGPLRINTAGTYVKQQLSGLVRKQSYCFAALVKYDGTTAAATGTAKFRVENVDGATVHKDFGSFASGDVTNDEANDVWLYGFWAPTDSINLDDIYLTIEHDAETAADVRLLVEKVSVVPVTYFNGLGFAWWNPYVDVANTFETRNSMDLEEMPIGSVGSIAVVNGAEGVINTFFRRAFNVQLPSDNTGSENIADTLAT